MNRTYRLVWNRALRVLQVASELARTAHHGGRTIKRSTVGAGLAALLLTTTPVWAATTYTNLLVGAGGTGGAAAGNAGAGGIGGIGGGGGGGSGGGGAGGGGGGIGAGGGGGGFTYGADSGGSGNGGFLTGNHTGGTAVADGNGSGGSGSQGGANGSGQSGGSALQPGTTSTNPLTLSGTTTVTNIVAIGGGGGGGGGGYGTTTGNNGGNGANGALTVAAGATLDANNIFIGGSGGGSGGGTGNGPGGNGGNGGNGTLTVGGTVVATGSVIVNTGAAGGIGSGNYGAGGTAGTGTLTINTGGLLQIGNGGAGASLSGNVTDNGTLTFDQSSSSSYLGTVSGTGTLTTMGTGTLTLGTVGSLASVSDAISNLILTGNVTTTGAQTYTGVVTLGGTDTLTGTAVSLAGGLTGAGYGLTITGNSTLSTVTGLSTLAVSGTSVLDGNVTTTGTQIYNSAVTLGSDATLASSGDGAIDFASTVDGAHNLVVNTGGVTTFGGAVGGTTALTSLTTDAAGSTTLDGNVTTTGAQTYSDTMKLGTNAVLTSSGNGAIDFASTLDGAHNLVVNTGGVTTFGGAVGGTTALTSLTTDAAGSTTLDGDVTTTGAQTYNGTMKLGTNAVLTSIGNGAIDFASTVDGADRLTVSTGGAATFAGAVGDVTALAGLTTSSGTFSANALTINGALSVTTTAGSITQTGAFTASGTSHFNSGANAITLTNLTNSFTGAVSLTGSNVSLANSAATTLGASTVSGTLSVSSNGTLTQVGAITADTLTGSSTGDTTLTGANLISTLGAFNASGNFSLTNTPALMISSTLSAANVTLNDSAGIIVTGTINAGGSTTIGNGTLLQIGNGGNTGSITGNVIDNGTLAFNQNSVATYASVISGTGTLTQSGTSVLTLSGANTYSGGTTINAGTVAVDNNMALGTGAINMAAGTTLAFDSSGLALANAFTLNGDPTFTVAPGQTDTVSGVIADGGTPGTLEFNGGGTLVLTGANTYSGGTTISAGTLQGDATSLQGNITDNAALVFNQNSAGTFAGVISGTGSLTQNGSGTLTLDGNSSGFVGTTEVQSGGLIVGSVAGNGAALGGNVSVDSGALLGGHGTIGGNVDVLSGGNLAPGNSIGTLTVNGNLSAAQGSVLDYEFGAPGANFTTLGTGDSVAVGGNLALNGAVLNVTNAGGFGPGLYNLFSYGGNLTETNGGITLGSTPSGDTLVIQTLTTSQQVNLLNATGLTLSFWNSNGLASTTQMGGGSGTWSVTSQNWTDATGSVTAPMQPQPGFAIFAGAPGTVTVDNSAGSVSATGLQFASDGYTLTGGTLTLVGSGGVAPIIRVGDGSAAGAGYTATISSVLAGTGGLTKADYGTLVLTGSNTYSGGTTINGGTLSVSSDGNLGATAGALTLDGGILEVTGTAFNSTTRSITLGNAGGGFDIANAGNTFTVAQALAGSGGLSKTGAGLLTLTGANTYSGGTTISSGTLQGNTTSLQGNIADNAALVFNQNTVGTFAGVISGTGSLTQSGSSTLILDGNSSAFGGSTTVQGGTLEVGDAATPSASLGGNVAVASDGTLRGHGTIGGNVTNGGTVWAGGSIGTLTIQGNYTQTAQGVLEVEAAPSGQASLLAVDGTASVAGSALVLGDAGTWAPRTNYTILTAAAGITGQFTSASSSLVFLNPVLSYTANGMDLSLERNDISFASVAQTPNQRAVAAVADTLGFGSPVYSALTTLDAPAAPHAFDQLSGVLHANTTTALVDDSRYVRDAINRHLLGQNDGAEGTTDQGGSVWTSAWGNGGHDGGVGNAPSLQANGSGMLVGADLPLGGDSRLGAVVGHGQDSIQTDSLDASEHVLDNHVGLYASSTFGPFVLRAGAVYTAQDVRSNRPVAFGTYSDALAGDHHMQTAQAYVEGGYQFNVSPGQQLEPFVNVARVQLHGDAWQESGGAAALAVAGNSTSVNAATLGLRDTLALDAAGGVHAHVSLGWQQAWGDLTPISSMRFESGGDSFDIDGVPVAQHALTTDLGIDFKLARNVTFDASYLGQFASHVQDQGARMSLTVTF